MYDTRPDTSEGFYDALADEYTEAIARCVPKYHDMLGTLLSYIPTSVAPRRILDLGCGTGNLTLQTLRWFPDARIDAVDISGEMIRIAENRIGEAPVTFMKNDFRDLDLEPEAYDLIVSSIAIHHLEDDDKERLMENVHSWLRPGGVLTFCDQFRGATDHLYSEHIQRWKESVADELQAGEWKSWMTHQEGHDHHATILQHFDWLRSAGFDVIDCTWRHLLWAVVYAQKG